MGRNGKAQRGEGIISKVNECITNENVLGYQTYWTLYKNKVNRDEFESAMEVNGFPKEMLRLQTDKCKFLEVVEEVANEYGTFVQKVVERGGRLVLKIVKPVVDKNTEEVDFQQDTTVRFDVERSAVAGEGVQEVIDEILLRFEVYRDKVSTEFIRLTYTDLLRDAGSVPMRGSGGIYFMPVTKSAVVEGITKLTEKFNLGTIYRMRLPAGKCEKAGIKDSVSDELEQRLKQYSERVESINKTSTLDKHGKLAKKEVENLFDIYSELLSEAVSVSDKEAEKLAMFKGIREKYSELEVSITERMKSIEAQA